MGKLSQILFWVGLVSFCLVTTAIAQKPATIQIEEILRKADQQRKIYIQEFKNLLSQETKTFEIYDKNGVAKKHRTVKSVFIIYQLSRGTNEISEFRNVVEVDGKPVDNADHRAQDFFEKIEKTESVDKELKKLHEESQRYDLDLLVNGYTLFRTVALDERLWPYFDYSLERIVTIDGADAYLISYQQTRECPFIAVNKKPNAPDVKLAVVYNVGLKDNIDYKGRLHGTLLIDAATFQVWREERAMTLQPEGFETRVPLSENTFEFQKSDFGIFTPKRITHTLYEFKQKEHISIKEGQITFEYEKFTKPDVEVKSSEVK
jgi:hypothetical protein